MPINNPNAKNFDQGVIANASGVTPASNWFSPLKPLQTVAPKGSPTRAFDYMSGANLLINPRSDEIVTYSHMRYVSDNCPLLCMAIETRKDQLSRLQWDVRLTNKSDMTPTQKEAAENDPRIKAVREFIKSPDKEYAWDGWLRKLMGEVLVTDSPSIYLRRTMLGEPYSAMILDGTTITRKVGLDGCTPIPPDIAYQQIIKGAPYVDFTSDELIFRPRNPRAHKLYGFSPVEQVIFLANLIMRRDMFKLNTYTEGNLPPALISVKDDWSADQIMDFQNKFDAVNQGDMAAMRRLQFIPEVSNLYMLKQDVLKDQADEWFARLVMYAFSLPPTSLVKEMNRATAEQASDSASDEGLAPMMRWVEDLMNTIIIKLFGYSDIEFTFVADRVIDPHKQAQIYTLYVNDGIMSRNQVLKELGYDDIEGGDILTYSTPNGLLPLADQVMSTADKIEQGLMPDPTAPKPAPFGAAPTTGGDPKAPTATPKSEDKQKSLRRELAEHYDSILEDLNPETSDPTIALKLLQLETGY